MVRAIVTLAVGENCYRPWYNHLRTGWLQWCSNHGYELVVFDNFLDISLRAKNRSPAWQKLLAMSSPEIASFEQVLWLDADVMVGAHAPDPLLGVPLSKVGMARDVGSPLAHEPDWFRRTWSSILLRSLGLNHLSVMNEMFSYLDLWGFDARRRPLWNSGVIAFSPKNHGALFRHIYETWSDGGPGALHEMVPLNLELTQRSLLHEIDPRFNLLFGVHHAVWDVSPIAVQRLHGLGEELVDFESFAVALAQRSFFLHFAGAHRRMERLLSSGCL